MYNYRCWSTHDVDHGYHWIIKGPITVTVVVSLGLKKIGFDIWYLTPI
jgi:hypothetical protein